MDLHDAVKHNDIERVRLLVEQRADKDQVDISGRTPLYLTSRDGHLEVTQYLVKQGAALDKANNDGWTPLIKEFKSFRINTMLNDLETTDGNVSKDPCGAKRIQLKPKFSMKSKTLQMQSNFISSTDNLEFSDDLNCTSSSNSTSFDSMKMDKKRKDTTLPCNTSDLQDLHAKAITACGEWERSVHTRYSAAEGRIVRSMNRYLVNQKRGYGRFNHESLFKSHRASDPSGRLYEETERGFELWKDFLEVRELMKKLKYPRTVS